MGIMFKITNSFSVFFLTFISAFVLITSVSCNKKNNAGGGTNTPVTFDAEVTIQANNTQQVIEGFGCATVFMPSNTSLTADESDRLFGSANNQVGLNILRIRLASDAGWRSIELVNAKEAIQRGAKVIATPWSPPASMKTNNNIIGGSLITDSSAAYASYLNDFASYMAANAAPLYAVSIQNEPDISVNYESCNWNADQMRDFLKNYGALITHTRVMAPESFNNNPAFVNSILNDDAAAANLDLVGGHIYGSGIVENSLAKDKGKEVWMTEHLDTAITYSADLNTAVEIHDCLTKANFNAYIWWYGKRFYGPIDENGFVTKRGYVMSQFARFIPPGSLRLGTTDNSRQEVLISAYKNTNGKKIIVAINTSSNIARQKITVTDAAISLVRPYVTTVNKNTGQDTDITAISNSFTYLLPPQSITTFVEQ
jgi:glucuronoarabinoxylan endo-1,4-beta-xylanase